MVGSFMCLSAVLISIMSSKASWSMERYLLSTTATGVFEFLMI